MSPVRLLSAFALSHVVVATWPGIDLAISGLFFDGRGFVRSHTLEVIRHAVWDATVVATLASLLAWALWSAMGRRVRVAPRLWGYVALVMLLGPGLLVNGVLKTYWGRPRPAEIVEFGGTAAFTPPFRMAGECARNCSFVSGEGAGAAALAIALGSLVRSWRLRAGLAATAVLVSAMRVATGRHFVSDVVFGAFAMAFVAMALFRLLRIGTARRTLDWASLRHDAGLVLTPLRRLIGRA